MISTILLATLWLLIVLYTSGAFMTLCNALRYRDVMAGLDANQLAHQPFQPKISIVVRCNPGACEHPIERIQELMALNYLRYEVILIVDFARNPKGVQTVIEYFNLKELPVPETLSATECPARAFYRNRKRLTLIDKDFYRGDDLRHTGAAACRSDYMLFVRSLDNNLIRNSLANMAIMKMRSPKIHISKIRAGARYDCRGPFLKTFFLILTELCNLRRICVAGKFKDNDYGQFVILEDISGRKGREEVVPKTQMFLHRSNRFYTYLENLAPYIHYKSAKGKLFSYMELLITFLFWGAGIHILLTPGVVNTDFWFLLAAIMLPLMGSTYSILLGEVLLKKDVNIAFVIRLVGVSFPESILFCLLHPWVWIINLINRRFDV